MKILKFGGTSVGSVEAIQAVHRIVLQEKQAPIVVVSAFGGVTDRLIDTAERAAQGQEEYENHFQSLQQHHLQIAQALIQDPSKHEVVQTQVLTLFQELGNLYKGVFLTKHLSARLLDSITAYGERLSSFIISRVFAQASLWDARDMIKTDFLYGKHVVDNELSYQKIQEAFANTQGIVIVPGFIASSKENKETTNLGRGGSDYTAALLAAALKAEVLEIWTDVDGFMSADPRFIDQAHVIDKLSYIEAMELCTFGAKIIYPPTLHPVYQNNIPIRIKNTFHPEAPGTYISKERDPKDRQVVKGISSIHETTLITVEGLGMVGIIGVNYRIFKALAKTNISVFMVAQASSENTTSLAVNKQDASRAVAALQEEFAHDIAQGEIHQIFALNDMVTIAIVGEKMKGESGIAGKLFNTLGNNGINVIACAEGASGRNLSVVIKKTNFRKALHSIHDAFFLSDYQSINLFLAGLGTVGKALLQQIQAQQNKLLEAYGLKIRIVGLANSKTYLLNSRGIDVNTYLDDLSTSSLQSSPEKLQEELSHIHLPNIVFVDCTANQELSDIYQTLLDNNISVVTANKIAASSPYPRYKKLKETANRKGVKFLFETNVGAGLPIINTINALINSGDRIQKIEAVLSGTLNFVFNTLSKDIPFSQSVKMAQEAGFAEPDPRIDLSGIDVIRKLVILSREAGHTLESTDVQTEHFIPEALFEGNVDEFFSQVARVDEDFEQKRLQLEAAGKRWRYCATFEKGEASVGLIEVAANHPFYELEGCNNIIMLTSDRYQHFPLIIKGYGAGAEVTAAGVFADIISIANVR